MSPAKIKRGWCIRKAKEKEGKRKGKDTVGCSNPILWLFLHSLYPSIVSLSPLSSLHLAFCHSFVSLSHTSSPSSFRVKTLFVPPDRLSLSPLFTASSYSHAIPYYSSYVNEFRLIIWERSRTENDGNEGVQGLAPKRGRRRFRYTVKDCPWIHCDGTLPALENFSSLLSLFLSLAFSASPSSSTSSFSFLHPFLCPRAQMLPTLLS